MINPMNLMGARKGGEYIPPGDTVGLWHFNSTLAATVGSDASVIETPGPNYVTGEFSQGIRGKVSDFTNPAILAPVNFSLSSFPSVNCTVEAFINASSGIARTAFNTNSSSLPISVGIGTSDFNMKVTTTDSTHLFYWNDTFYPDLSAATWYHMALVFDGDNEEVRLYVDGSWIHTADATGKTFADIDDLRMGTDDKYLDEVRVSSVVRYTGETTYTVPTSEFAAD